MSKKDKRQPKIASSPQGKEVRAHYQPHSREARAKENPGSTDHFSPAWQFHLCDKDHELWGWEKLKPDEFIDLITQHLKNKFHRCSCHIHTFKISRLRKSNESHSNHRTW